LFHLGDFVAKGPDSLQILSQFSDANVTGVRGNHDQMVIEWRAWIEWVEEHRRGKSWLKKLERKYKHGFHSKKPKHKLKWAIPRHWEFMGDHYNIAR
jgi:predicted phosphodiesterase